MQKAIYAGSFDPFTNGHLEILKQAASIFEEVHVLVALNLNKTKLFSEVQMGKIIEKILERENLTNCKVRILEGLLAKYSEEHNIHYLVRGLRNNMDYLYEENLALINHEINPELNSIFFRTNNPHISSSFVRELIKYKEDISKYVPEEVEKASLEHII